MTIESSVIIDLSSMREAKRQIAEFGDAALEGLYDGFVDDIRRAQREALIRKSKLSPREIDIFCSLAMAKPIKVVAGNIGVSQVTVKVQIREVKKKLSAATGTKVDSTLKMVLLYWGVTGKALVAEQNNLPSVAPKRHFAKPTADKRLGAC